MDHNYSSPDVQRAVLATARAVLGADLDAAHEAAEQVRWTGACPDCMTVTAVQLGLALCASLAGQPFVTGELHARLAAAIDAAEAELRAAPN